MKKFLNRRVIYYSILGLFLIGFLFFNYSSVQKCGDIKSNSVTSEKDIIIVKGELVGDFRSVKKVTTNKIDSSYYITVEGVNDFFGSEKQFEVAIPNKNNSVEKIYFSDKKDFVEIFTNADFGKQPEIIKDTYISGM